MRTKQVIAVEVLLMFLASLTISVVLTYVKTDALAETRRSVLVKGLREGQIRQIGAFHWYDSPGAYYWWERQYVSELSTSDALAVLAMLNVSYLVDVNQALRYIAVKQYDKDTGAGGFGAVFESTTFCGCDLYSTYKVVRLLNLYGALDRINQTRLVDFITKRYDASVGAFHELITEANGQEYASSRFPMVFRSFQNKLAYVMPNIISTYAGVCALNELDRLDLINSTKVFDWIMHCQAENGLFSPFPSADYMPLPEWSPIKTNPFEVDHYGTGVPYTFAAISVLEVLGRLDAVLPIDRQKIVDYLYVCQGNITGMISIHEDYDYGSPSFTYEAVMILRSLGMLDEAEAVVGSIVKYFQTIQALSLDNSWPIPEPGRLTPSGLEKLDYYGLHYGDTGPPTDSYYAVAVLQATGKLELLDQPTPRVQRAWINLIILSTLATAISTASLLVALGIKQRKTAHSLKQ